MNKQNFLMVLVTLLLIGTGILIGIKISNLDLAGQFLTKALVTKIIISGLILSSLILIIYLIIKFNIWNKILSFYRLNLNGKFILRATSMINYRSEITNYQQFKDKLAQFQGEYDFLEYNVNYSSKSIDIELNTPQQLGIRNGEEFLEEFVGDLNEMIALLSTEQIFIDLNITGEVNNLVENINFVVANQNNKVGLNKNRYSNNILGKFIYN
ncbi:hypothetical protein Halha_1112 [Halobacteroides halobius DSM 5150]|uniref:Uncharacterized protein n=1 Tax=Halobacteroides halobius (strain ATCC 35273 / DSM 5150 / MD-1) TaxID=748449 RepID=L0KAD1_HALHC|nr:hypothetical protein [Halobacteroides halobius]AGB41063.1 hypothetical protein Halha_1112 [Halobacteroides halobius DSM 5150]